MTNSRKCRETATTQLRNLIKPHPDDYDGYPYLSIVTHQGGFHTIGVMWILHVDKSRVKQEAMFLNLTHAVNPDMFSALDEWKMEESPILFLCLKGFNVEGLITTLDVTCGGTSRKSQKPVSVIGTLYTVEVEATRIKRRKVVSQLQYLKRMKLQHKPQVLPTNNGRYYFE